MTKHSCSPISCVSYTCVCVCVCVCSHIPLENSLCSSWSLPQFQLSLLQNFVCVCAFLHTKTLHLLFYCDSLTSQMGGTVLGWYVVIQYFCKNVHHTGHFIIYIRFLEESWRRRHSSSGFSLSQIVLFLHVIQTDWWWSDQISVWSTKISLDYYN